MITKIKIIFLVQELIGVKMKTVKEIRDTFSPDEIKILIEIVKGKQDFDVMGDEIKDFYSDEYEFIDEEDDRQFLLEKLEFDLEMGGII
jgi:hypothetical protein